MNSVNFQSRLRRNFSGSVNFQAVFSSDSVNVAGPLSKTATKSMSQPILLNLIQSYPVEMRGQILYLANRWTEFDMLLTSNRFLDLIRFLLQSFPPILQILAQFR